MKVLPEGQNRRDEVVRRMVQNAPVASKTILGGAYAGKVSPRAAIKAQCLCCVNFARKEIRDCTGYSCPLFVYRPYQIEGEEE